MRLPQPFFQLPIFFDVARLQAEVASVPPEAWAKHPTGMAGNSAVRLISAGGAETDAVHGQMLPTRWLDTMPYVRQVLAGFGVVWGRSRLMRLAPGADVPEHVDVNYHWHTRVRMHIPVFTQPAVRFHCGGETVHMAAGEAWIFDNWRVHSVENKTPHERIHLVADTTGTAAFWQFACGQAPPRERWLRHAWRPNVSPQLMTEVDQRSPVMPAAEVKVLIDDMVAELAPSADTAEARARAVRFGHLLESFLLDWRQLCALHGTGGQGRRDFQRLAGALREAVQSVGEGLVMRSNDSAVVHVLDARILRYLVAEDEVPLATTRPDQPLDRPVFIIAAPRSGSTLLFETLACTPGFRSFGGEAHWLIEDVPALRPGAPGVDCNRLTAAQATPEVTAAIRRAALARLLGPQDRPSTADAPLLEKTPKNSLRIPFLKQVFPDARFIFLWRDPRENISSIMEAWRAGGWVTYRALDGWDGPWSMLLPPGWQSLRGAPLESVAAWQWQCVNETVLDDLRQLPREDWTSVGYHEFVADPEATIRRLCSFAKVPFDAALQARTSGALPPSRHTHTKPAPEKWRSNEAAINRVLPNLETCWQRLRELR